MIGNDRPEVSAAGWPEHVEGAVHRYGRPAGSPQQTNFKEGTDTARRVLTRRLDANSLYGRLAESPQQAWPSESFRSAHDIRLR